MADYDIESIFAVADSLRNLGGDTDNPGSCSACGLHGTLILCYKDGHEVCTECGCVQANSIYENCADCPILCCSNYKRLHHFHERISQLLLQETPIPHDEFAQIEVRLAKEPVLNKAVIRQVLRSLKMQKYIEKWLQIIYRLTGMKPPPLTTNICHKLDTLFTSIQEPFMRHKPKDRKNFLNYNYVFHRFFQMLGVPQFSMFFPMIKSKSKLQSLDDTWSLICSDLKWDYEPLQIVPQFAVKQF